MEDLNKMLGDKINEFLSKSDVLKAMREYGDWYHNWKVTQERTYEKVTDQVLQHFIDVKHGIYTEEVLYFIPETGMIELRKKSEERPTPNSTKVTPLLEDGFL